MNKSNSTMARADRPGGQRFRAAADGPRAQVGDRGPERGHAGDHAARGLVAGREGPGQEPGRRRPGAGVSPAAVRQLLRRRCGRRSSGSPGWKCARRPRKSSRRPAPWCRRSRPAPWCRCSCSPGAYPRTRGAEVNRIVKAAPGLEPDHHSLIQKGSGNGNGNRQTSCGAALFKSASDLGAQWLFVILPDGWAITRDGEQIAAGTGDRASIDEGVKQFLTLTVRSPARRPIRSFARSWTGSKRRTPFAAPRQARGPCTTPPFRRSPSRSRRSGGRPIHNVIKKEEVSA